MYQNSSKNILGVKFWSKVRVTLDFILPFLDGAKFRRLALSETSVGRFIRNVAIVFIYDTKGGTKHFISLKSSRTEPVFVNV
jgi:hypothetical protein